MKQNTECPIMYSEITNIYYRKTAEHLFTKPVQIEGTQNFFFPPVSYFSSQFKFLPLGNASVRSEKMASSGEKSFCMLEYHTSKFVVTEQRAFRANYANDPPTDKTIRAQYKQITETGCLCKQKSSGRTLTAEYRSDVCHDTRRAQIEYLQLSKKKNLFTV